ncbi:MAG: SEC-C metal-binding domain-containing protein [Peptostreptococcaceae bacterium]|nr:SEC-C metal-binding domain-containing protein [Peptostreptococcaceae bacterium]MDY5739642.1 SEC-C metal-binding domain-containing protein [Anaerovoracaceae bacterium]
MTLFKEWRNLIDNQSEESFEEFWKEYSDAETKIYKDILANKDSAFTGKIADLAEKYQVREVIFMGFLDGIGTSLTEELNVEALTADSTVDLKIDFSKLFFNMLKADADYLFGLEEWDDVLTPDERRTIYKDFKRSQIVHVEKKPGRNDPCPCGSGKKYKKCCGNK